MSIFSERLQESLQDSQLSQKQLAERASVTEAAVSNYLRGVRVPRGATLQRLAKALNTTTDFLLGNEGTGKKDAKIELLQRNLQKLDEEQLKKAEDVLKVIFDDFFKDEDKE